MTDKPTPATDEEIARVGAWNCDCSWQQGRDFHTRDCLMIFGPRLIARIESDREENARLRAEIERLKKDAARHEEEEAANCPEDQSCIETIKALRAELAQAREEIERLMGIAETALVDLADERADHDITRMVWKGALYQNRKLKEAQRKAEARVKELEDTLAGYRMMWRVGDAILAARAKEGEQR